jgi:hypothetical protein
VNLGDTFIWSPDGRREHLYIAVTDPRKNNGDFVVFNLTKSKGGTKSLTFKIGDHPFITKYDSDVNFGDGLIVSLKKIQTEISYRRAFPNQPMDLSKVQRIARFA